MAVFWEKGFRRTSMADLEAATGVLRGSLYWAFGDKRTIFERAMEHYQSLTRRVIGEYLGAAGPVSEVLRRTLLAVASECTGEDGRKGCLMANSAVELSAHDDEARAAVRRHYAWMESRFASLLARAQETGQLAPERDPQALGRLIVVSIQGLKVVGKTSPQSADLAAVVDELLAGLGLEPT